MISVCLAVGVGGRPLGLQGRQHILPECSSMRVAPQDIAANGCSLQPIRYSAMDLRIFTGFFENTKNWPPCCHESYSPTNFHGG